MVRTLFVVLAIYFLLVVPVHAGTTWIPARPSSGTTWVPARPSNTTWIPNQQDRDTTWVPTPLSKNTTWVPAQPSRGYEVWGDGEGVIGRVHVSHRNDLVYTDYDFDEPYHCRLQSIKTVFNHASYTYGVNAEHGQSCPYQGTYIAPRDAVLAFDINNTPSYPAGHFTSYLTFDCEGRQMNARTSTYTANTGTFRDNTKNERYRGDVNYRDDRIYKDSGTKYYRDYQNERVYRENESHYDYTKSRLWQKWYGNRW
jgi:hypothetical protein